MNNNEFTKAAAECNLTNEQIAGMFSITYDLVRRWRTGLAVPREDIREFIVRQMAMEEQRILATMLVEQERKRAERR